MKFGVRVGVYQGKYQSVNKSFPLEVGKGDGQERLFILQILLYIFTIFSEPINTIFTSLKKIGWDLDPFVVS